MKPFETLGPDGRIYIHNERWNEWRDQHLAEYPCPAGKYRFEIEIEHSNHVVGDIPVEQNPHAGRYNPHYCFYHCNDWSTIFGEHPNGRRVGLTCKYRMIIESGNPDPVLGTRIPMYSTSSSLHDEPWGQNRANIFCFLWGAYWRVSQLIPFHEWHPTYPITRDREFVYMRGQPGGYPGQERAWAPLIPHAGPPVQFEMHPYHREVRNWYPEPVAVPVDELFNDLGPTTKNLMESWLEFNGIS